MDKRFLDIVENTFRLKEVEGESKVVSLEEAIKRNVKPGKKLYFSMESNAAALELLRQYWGTSPEFTLIMGGIAGYHINLIHCGLVKELIYSMSSHMHPTPGPVGVLQAAYKKGVIHMENWSMWSLQQRLMASAFGVGFMPTNSLVGTGMAEENKEDFMEIQDPFGTGSKFGLVRALDVDVSLVHGCVADCYGNTILGNPWDETMWASRASTDGVVVTVEKIVPTSCIRKHSNLVGLPGYLVNSVSEVPFGAHPRGLVNSDVKEFEDYSSDYDSMENYRRATDDPAKLDEWIEEWVLNCQTHEDYLRKLGTDRLVFLRNRADEHAWKCDLESSSDMLSADEEFTAAEMMIVAAADKIREIVVKNGYRTILTGIGVSALAVWLAHLQLLEESYEIDLVFGSGQYGFAPRPADPFMASIANVPTCKMLTNLSEVYGVIVGGRNNRCLSTLGAAQIDKQGNINISKLGDLFLIGAGGAADAINAQETMVVMRQSRNRFVESVPYISCPGAKVKTLISTMGVFEKLGDDSEFTLTGYFADHKLATVEDKVSKVVKNCDWPLKVALDVSEVQPPTLEQLMIIRLLDPRRFYIGD